MTTAAHQLLDHLLDDLKKELFEKMHQNIVLELEKQKRNLQNMVAEMLTERKGEMLVVMMNKVHREIMKEQEKIMKEQEKIMKEQEKMVEDMLAQRKEEMLEEMLNKVHREIKQEVEMYAQGTNAAMDDFMGEMKCQLYVHIQKMVEKEVSLQFLSTLSTSLYFLSTSNMRHTKCIATYTSSNLKHFNFFWLFWMERRPHGSSLQITTRENAANNAAQRKRCVSRHCRETQCFRSVGPAD